MLRRASLMAVLVFGCSPAKPDAQAPPGPTGSASASAAPLVSAAPSTSASPPPTVATMDAGAAAPPDPTTLLAKLDGPPHALELHGGAVFAAYGQFVARVDPSGAIDPKWHVNTSMYSEPQIAAGAGAMYVLESFRGEQSAKAPNHVLIAGKWAQMAIYFHRIPDGFRPGEGKPTPIVHVGRGLAPYALPAFGGCGLAFLTGTLTSDMIAPEVYTTLNLVRAPGAPATAIATGLARPEAVAVDDAHVLWAEDGAEPGRGAVSRVPCAGGAKQVVARGEADPRELAVSTTHACWIAGPISRFRTPHGARDEGGELRCAPKAGGAPRVVASGVMAFAVDGANLVLADARGLATVPIAGGEPTRLLSRAQITRVRADASRFVFATGNEVRALPRAPAK